MASNSSEAPIQVRVVEVAMSHHEDLCSPTVSAISGFWASFRQMQLFQLSSSVCYSTQARAMLLSIAVFAVPFVMVYSTTCLRFVRQRSNRKAVRSPPVIPYMVPYVGSALRFALNPPGFLASAMSVFRAPKAPGTKSLTSFMCSHMVGSQTAYGVRVLSHHLYFLRRPENVAQLRKYKTSITSPGIQTFVLRQVFGMHDKAINAYSQDNSGIRADPHGDSNVAPHNRVDHLTHVNFHESFNGGRLVNLYTRWSRAFERRYQALGIEDQWMHHPDIMDFWMPPLTAALNEAIAGPVLEHVNPNFTEHFLKFLPYVHPLMKGLPRWCLPEAYSLRDSLNRDVKQWHAIARAKFQASEINEDGDADPWWGSTCVRQRQGILGALDNWDYDSIASSDFGLLWG